jgi:hypothetical protein
MPPLSEMDVPVLDVYAGPGYDRRATETAEASPFDQADIDAVVRAVNAIPDDGVPPLFHSDETKPPTSRLT